MGQKIGTIEFHSHNEFHAGVDENSLLQALRRPLFSYPSKSSLGSRRQQSRDTPHRPLASGITQRNIREEVLDHFALFKVSFSMWLGAKRGRWMG